mmetsp:Transcript_54918/g.154029  ORF Transcript_54918/g.154029 Transcript_54918/m.154029 type:complete len:243 (-) Transcript_54918:62-790(-)
MHVSLITSPAAMVSATAAISAWMTPAQAASQLAWAEHSEAAMDSHAPAQIKDDKISETCAEHGSMIASYKLPEPRVLPAFFAAHSCKDPAIMIPAREKYSTALAAFRPHHAPRALRWLSSVLKRGGTTALIKLFPIENPANAINFLACSSKSFSAVASSAVRCLPNRAPAVPAVGLMCGGLPNLSSKDFAEWMCFKAFVEKVPPTVALGKAATPAGERARQAARAPAARRAGPMICDGRRVL